MSGMISFSHHGLGTPATNLLQELQIHHCPVPSQPVLGTSCLPSPPGLGQMPGLTEEVEAGALPSTFQLTCGSHHSLWDFEGTTPGAEAVPTVTAAPLWRKMEMSPRCLSD